MDLYKIEFTIDNLTKENYDNIMNVLKIMSTVENIKTIIRPLEQNINITKDGEWHHCKYCGGYVNTPDELCYKNPNTVL